MEWLQNDDVGMEIANGTRLKLAWEDVGMAWDDVGMAWDDVGMAWDDVGIHCVTYVQGHAAQLTVSILLRANYTNHVCVR